jgi:hypothetical protein
VLHWLLLLSNAGEGIKSIEVMLMMGISYDIYIVIF